jgi:hypothetical protein
VPIAVVASVVDDLLDDGAGAAHLPIAGGGLRFDDVMIDARGVARFADATRASVEAIAMFVVRALGEDPPAAALPVIARFSTEGARDAAQLRAWVREALGGAIATHDEVAALVRELGAPPAIDSSGDLPPTQPTPLGIASAAIDFLAEERTDGPTEIIRPRPLPSFPESFAGAKKEAEIPILSAIPEPSPPTELPQPLESSEPVAAPQPQAQQGGRPVIRHQLQKPNVRVHSAPAARRSAKPVADPRDSLRIPHDRPHWGAWLFVILLLVIGALFWLRYL